MFDNKFRFGVVAMPNGGTDGGFGDSQDGAEDSLAERWRATARRAEDLGYSTLLMPEGVLPDGRLLPAPFPALAVAACVTTTLRVGTFVLASPLRAPRSAAWEGHSLSVLTEGRFEFGIGTGRPDVRTFAESLGRPWGSAGERLRLLAESIEYLRELDDARRTPVLVTAGGPKALALAGRMADIVSLAAPPFVGRDHLVGMATRVRDAAGDRATDIEIAMNLVAVGDDVPSLVQQTFGVDHATLVAHDSQIMLYGSPVEMADELQRRRDAYGLSYVTVLGAYLDRFAPVLERLVGR